MKKHIQKAADSSAVRFVIVGIINTLVDFGILNLLTQLTDLNRIPANIISASVAMIFSFVANRTVVFRSTSANKRRQAVLFVLVTITGLYIIQNAIIYLLTEVWTWPLDTAYDILPQILDKDTFFTNASKVIATGASLVWNFVLYKKVVFNDELDNETSEPAES